MGKIRTTNLRAKRAQFRRVTGQVWAKIGTFTAACRGVAEAAGKLGESSRAMARVVGAAREKMKALRS